MCFLLLFFCFKQKTAYEMRISDWSSDVCSSDLSGLGHRGDLTRNIANLADAAHYLCMLHGRHPGVIDHAAMRTAHNDARGWLIQAADGFRSEARRVGKECVSTCRSRWSPYN